MPVEEVTGWGDKRERMLRKNVGAKSDSGSIMDDSKTGDCVGAADNDNDVIKCNQNILDHENKEFKYNNCAEN